MHHRRPSVRVLCVLVAGAVLVGLGGCGAAPGTSGSTPTPTVTISPTTSDPTDPAPLPTATTRTPVTVTGIPGRGVEAGCLLLDRYLLIGGDRALLESGVKVTVTGHTEPDGMSTCQQGVYLVVETVTPTG